MPLASARLALLGGKTLAGAVTGLGLTTSRNLYGDAFDYLGKDSSGTPVFGISYIDNTNSDRPTVVLFRMNSDFGFTSGTAYVLDTNARSYASLVADNTQGYVFCTYKNNSGPISSVCLECDLDNLSILSEGNTITGSFSGYYLASARLGSSSKFIAGSRGGNNGVMLMTSAYERTSGTNITTIIGRTDIKVNGQGNSYDAIGFNSDRFMVGGRGNNGNNHTTSAAEVSGTSIPYFRKNMLGGGGNSMTKLAPLDSQGKVLVVGRSNGTTRTSIAEADWASNVFSEGNITTIKTVGSDTFEAVSGHADNEGYIVDMQNNLVKYKKVTASGVTSTLDTDWTELTEINGNNLNIQDGSMHPFRSVTQGTKNILAGITRASGEIVFVTFAV